MNGSSSKAQVQSFQCSGPKILMIQLVSQKFSCRARKNQIFWRLPRKIVDLVTTFSVKDIDFVDLSCENGHKFTDRLRDINTEIHQEVKPYS